MSDYLLNLSSSPLTRRLVKAAGAPTPQRLARASTAYEAAPLAGKRIVLGSLRPGPTQDALAAALKNAGGDIAALNGATLDVAVYDASGLTNVSDLRSLYEFFHAVTQRLETNARVLLVSACPEDTADSATSAARRAVEGFTRSLAKEIGKRGATANLLVVEAGAEIRLEAALRFFLSPRCAYVSGQPVRIGTATTAPAHPAFVAPLKNKIALLTGAAGGIGSATARRLSEEGAQVVCVDIPAAQAALETLAREIGGDVLALDLTAPESPDLIAAHLRRLGGVDVVIHNAGITRDKTIAKMDSRRWDECLMVNLEALIRIDRALEQQNLLRDEARVVCLSSIAGVAGNVGQTNYASAKAGVIGYVAAQAKKLAVRGITVNAVAPGFIETPLMMAVPFLIREFARRANSLSQGGVPRDAAELLTFLSTPGAYGISGQTIRVCGQNLIGA